MNIFKRFWRWLTSKFRKRQEPDINMRRMVNSIIKTQAYDDLDKNSKVEGET